MAIGNVPGDLVASLILDSVTLATEPGSVGVAVSSVVADGPSALRVTLSGPADIGGTIAIAEVDSNGGAPFVAVCEPTGAPNEWRVSWSPVGGGGGGVTSVSASSPLSATTLGGAVALSFVNGTGAGQLLTWNGTKWVAQLPAAPAVPIHLSIDTRTPTTVSYELRGAVYFDAPFTFAAGCRAYWFQGGSVNTSYMQLSDAAGVQVAEWVSTTNVGAPRFIDAVLSAPFVGTTVPAGWYHIDVKYTSGGASFSNGLGLFLTE